MGTKEHTRDMMRGPRFVALLVACVLIYDVTEARNIQSSGATAGALTPEKRVDASSVAERTQLLQQKNAAMAASEAVARSESDHASKTESKQAAEVESTCYWQCKSYGLDCHGNGPDPLGRCSRFSACNSLPLGYQFDICVQCSCCDCCDYHISYLPCSDWGYSIWEEKLLQVSETDNSTKSEAKSPA